jgi:diacylglycerol kinase (ATP)
MADTPHIAFIVHGKIKAKSRLLAKLSEHFQSIGTLTFFTTKPDMCGLNCSSEALRKGATILIAVGGDGTVNEVANAILTNPKASELKMGILPFGTGNDFCRSLGITKDLATLRKNILFAKSRQIDVAELEFTGKGGNPSKRYFVNIADVGLGGFATQMLRTGRSIWGSGMTYFFVILRSFLFYKPVKIKFFSENFEFESPAMSICMANGKYFASGLGIAPEAKVDDGLLDWVFLLKISVWDYLKKLPQLKKGRKIQHPQVSYGQGTQCKITGEHPIPIDMDGEFVGFTPLKCRIMPSALTILA